MSLYVRYVPMLLGGGAGQTLSIGALDSQAANAAALTIAAGKLSTQSASASFPGVVNTAAQTFAGVKTLSSGLILPQTTISTPSLSAVGDPLSGLYMDLGGWTATEVSLVSNGHTRLVVDDYAGGSSARIWLDCAKVFFPQGTVGSPAISFHDRDTQGFYMSGGQEMSYANQGTQTVKFTQNLMTVLGQHVVTGQSDAVQLSVTGFSTQTSNLLQVFKSDATSLFSVDNSGKATAISFSGDVATLTAKGDLLTSNGTHNVALPVGANGLVLSADSTQASGLKYISVLSNPMTTLGDIIYENATPTAARLAGNTTAVKQFLSQTGTGTISAAPAWAALASGDIPNLDAGKITTGTLATARGGTNSDSSASTGIAHVSSGSWTYAAVDLSGADATGTLAAGRFPALTGDITTSAGALGTTLASSISGAKTFSTSITSPAHISSTANAASTGVLRLADTDAIKFRNHANGADIALAKDTSDQLSWAGTSFLSASGVLLAAGFPALTGDITTSAGALATTAAATQANITSLSNAAGVAVHGSNTNDSAGAGYVGEFLQNRQTTLTGIGGSSGQYVDLVSQTFTAGDWDISLVAVYQSQATNGITFIATGISTTTGNSSTGLQSGDNFVQQDYPAGLGNGTFTSQVVPVYRMSFSTSTVVYGKGFATWATTAPKVQCRLSGRRVR